MSAKLANNNKYPVSVGLMQLRLTPHIPLYVEMTVDETPRNTTVCWLDHSTQGKWNINKIGSYKTRPNIRTAQWLWTVWNVVGRGPNYKLSQAILASWIPIILLCVWLTVLVTDIGNILGGINSTGHQLPPTGKSRAASEQTRPGVGVLLSLLFLPTWHSYQCI